MKPPLLRRPLDGGKGGHTPGEGRGEKIPFPPAIDDVRGERAGTAAGAGGEESRAAAGSWVENLDIFGLDGRMVDSV